MGSLGGGEGGRRKKKRSPRGSLCTTFLDQYSLPGEALGRGSHGAVETCVNVFTQQQFAVKVIRKVAGVFHRAKVLREIELYHLCRGEDSIVQLVEYFEEPDAFYLVFEKMAGGPLLAHLQRRGSLTEEEAAAITSTLTTAITHLHALGVAHRDIKPENVLCVSTKSPWPVKLCDFDLCSSPGSTEEMASPVGSLEFMAPEVVDTFVLCQEDEELSLRYTRACDLWSLGVLLYLLLSGVPPWSGACSSPSCTWEVGGECSSCRRHLLAAISCHPLTFPPSRWLGVSPSARHLVRSLLERDAAARATPAQVAAHPWLTGAQGARGAAREAGMRAIG